MPFNLQSVKVTRFKQLKETPLDLGDITLLVGPNNSGKSSVLQAVHFAVSIAQSARLIGDGVRWRGERFELSIHPTQLIYSPSNDVLSLGYNGELREGNANRAEIALTTTAGEVCTAAFSRGRNRNVSIVLDGKVLGQRLMNLDQPFTVFAPGLAGVAREERLLSTGVVHRMVARGDANLVLRNVFRMLKQNEATWQSFLLNMRHIFPGLSVEVRFNESADEHLAVNVSVADGPRLPIESAGTSVLQVSQILGYIELFHPQLLILDEPDSHLHPDRQRSLFDLLCRLAKERQFQIIVSTHSRHVLDTLRDRARIVWLNKGQVVETPDNSVTPILLDLGALDSADYFANGHLRCIVASEDSDLTPLKTLLESNGFVMTQTDVRSYAGCTNVHAAIVFGEFLRDKAPAIRVVVHRDRDYLSEDSVTAFAQRLGSVNIDAFVTPHNDIESHFLNAQHLHALNPSIQALDIAAIIETATQATKDASISALTNLRIQFAQEAQRRGVAGQPNFGQIAAQARIDYETNPNEYRRGDKVLGQVKQLMQQALGGPARIFQPTPHLVDTKLRSIATELWPIQ